MSEDFRQDLINAFRESLVSQLSYEQIDFAVRKLVQAMDSYEVTKRTTAVAVYDDTNARIIKRYLACLTVDGKSPKTIEQYRRAIVELVDVVQKPVTEMGQYDVRFYLAQKKDGGCSNRYLENIRSYIATFFQWMTDEELIPKNPCARVKPIKYVQEVRLAFSDTEIDRLRSACTTKKQRAIIELLLSSGVRCNELTTMLVKDIDLDKLTVLVRNGKGGKQRLTYINQVAAYHIRAYLNERSEMGEGLFYSKNHEPISNSGITYILNDLGKRAGVPDVHPHRFRRTFATKLFENGMGLPEIQRLLGHSNVNTTMTYVAVNDNKVRTSYDQCCVS